MFVNRHQLLVDDHVTRNVMCTTVLDCQQIVYAALGPTNKKTAAIVEGNSLSIAL